MKKYAAPVLLLGLICCTSLLLSCSKEPDVIIEKEIITVTDTIIIVDTVTVIETILQTIPDTATTYILVRHAETSGGGSNPSLAIGGQERAMELSRILEQVPLDAVLSTNFNRTMQTAEPTASAKGLSIQTYDPFAPEAVIESTLNAYHNGFVLIVGHSNTTPDLLNTMVGENTYSTLPESEYNNLFIVSLFEKGRAKVVHLKYGN